MTIINKTSLMNASYILAKDMMPPKPSLLLLETVEFGELALESESASESLASFKLFGRSNF